MNSLILAVRAISGEFARRIFIPLFVKGVVTLVVLIAVGAWLVTTSAWWWTLLVPFIIVSVIFIVLSIIAKVILSVVTPRQSFSQRQEVARFVDTLQKVSDTVQTSKIILLFRLVHDTLQPSEDGLVKTMSNHVSSTKRDFAAIQSSFEPHS